MWNKDNIQEELQGVAPGIVELQHLETYAVPEFYFSSLAAIIIERVSGKSKPDLIDSITGKVPYSAPAGYFEGLAAQIMAKVHSSSAGKTEVEQELELIAPALVGLNKSQVYSVPAGYFENLTVPVIAKPVGKVVSMYGAGKVLKYLAAAVVIAVMVFSAYLFFDKPADTGTANNSTQAPPNLVTLNVTAAVSSLSEDEILDYLQAVGVEESTISPVYIPDEDADFNEIINHLSEEELRAFLNQYSEGTQTLLKNS